MEQGDFPIEPLYSHVKRPAWGLAILASEMEDKREYQFQDGEQRTINERFWRLMQPVQQPPDRALEIVRELKTMVRATRAHQASTSPAKSGPPPISFEEQLRFFRSKWPEGMGSAAWTTKVRGGEGITEKKRHREPAIARAQELLSAEALA